MATTINQYLDDAKKAKLKDVLGFDVRKGFPYTPKLFRDPELEIPKDLWPVFVLESKDGVEICRIEDDAGYMTIDEKTNSPKMHLQTGKRRLNTLRNGISKILRFPLDDGRSINYDKKIRDLKTFDENGELMNTKSADIDHVIKFLRVDLQNELVNAINERSTLTPEELQGLEY